VSPEKEENKIEYCLKRTGNILNYEKDYSGLNGSKVDPR
jgi:hypothetical protein